MTSGARYHRVATYSVSTPVWSCEVSHTRASPKSQIYNIEIELGNMICIALSHLQITVAVQ